MKSLVIFFWLWIICLVKSKILSLNEQSLMIPSSELDDEESFALVSIHELLVQYFSKNCREIGLVAVGMPGGSAETMSDKLIKSMPENISVRVMNQKMAGEFKNSKILLFDSKQHFDEFELEKHLGSNRGVWYKHLIYVPGLQTQDVIEEISSDPTISEVNFLVNYDGDSFDLAASFMFTAESCQPNQIKTINRFTRATQRWESLTFFPDKYKNFHGCTIEVHHDDSTIEFGKTLIDKMSKQLNFKVTTIHHEGNDFFLNVNDSHLMIDKINTQANSAADLLVSSALTFVHLVFVVPPGEPLTDLQRMFAAFDGPTWIAIGATFGIALLVIQLIKFMPREVQDFAFGRNIRTPTLNVFSVFLTGSQHRVPGRNFSRYHLVMFMMWSMIFRTCYQSMMFEHLNGDLRYPRIKTIDGLNEKNFTLVCDQDYESLLAHYMFDYNKSIELENGTYWFDIVPEPANKLYYIMYRSWYLYELENKYERNFLPSTNVLEENLATAPMFMFLPFEVPYSQTIREKVDEMLASGLIQKWDSGTDYISTIDKEYVAEVERQVLTVKSLRFGFLIYLILLALSFVVFLIEVLMKPVEVWILSRLA